MDSQQQQQHPHLLHVVAVPYPLQGHINPLLQLCEQLAPRGFTFTFINTHHIHQRLHRAGNIICPSDPAHDEHDGNARVCNGVYHYKGCPSIRMVSVEGGRAPEQHARRSTFEDAFRAAQEMYEPVERLLSHIMEERAVNFFLSDVVLAWSNATAVKFGLPWVSFYPTSAASLSVFAYLVDLATQGVIIPQADVEDEEAPLFEDIPGLPPTSRCDVPKLWDAQGKLDGSSSTMFTALEQASMVLVNSYEELEGQVLQALSKRFPIQAIGPLLPSRYLLPTCPDNKAAGRPSLFIEESSCLSWLDTQAPSSVLFISFGSTSLRSDEQLQELAKAVEATACPFLWVCRQDISHWPDSNRGLIVDWAPQLEVLSHPSVGGFITHCGWNSIIESTSLGVPMLCWADHSERTCNQRLVVEFLKCGIYVVADGRRAKQHIDDGVLIGRDEIEKSIRFLMLEEGGASLRRRSAKLREAAIESYQRSDAQLNQIAHTMKQRCLEVT